MYIDKAILQPGDKLTLNTEPGNYNQIKTSETLLKDNIGCAWIVGYYAKYNGTTEVDIQGTIEDNVVSDYSSTTQTLDQWLTSEYGITSSDTFYKNISYDVRFSYNVGSISGVRTKYYKILNFSDVNDLVQSSIDDTSSVYATSSRYLLAKDTPVSITSTFVSDTNTFITNYVKTLQTNLRNSFIFKDKDNKVYSVRQVYINTGFSNQYYATSGLSINTDINSMIIDAGGDVTSDIHNNCYVKLWGDSYKLEINEITSQFKEDYHITTSRYNTIDAPYNLFAIPYGIKSVYEGTVQKIQTYDNELALNIAIGIVKDKTQSTIYDIQLLPYCPIQNISCEDGVLTIPSDSQLYSWVINHDDNTKITGIIFNVTYSKGTFNISNTISVTNPKMSNQMDMYRLCSPSYNGQFEFTPAKNGGIEYFNVDYTYKPYNPYIHINPNFKNLYGGDYNDARGLVCGGDFSLPIVNDTWAQYQLQNKNYEATFQREITHQEKVNTYTNISNIASSVTSALGTGINAGLVTGNPLVGIGAGIASGIGGAIDTAMSIGMQQENLNYAKDMHEFQLGNIKAMPNSIAKTTAFTNNNKIFPVLEYYTCTDREKEVFANSIRYQGMTVNAIGTIEDYINNSWSYGDITDKGYIRGSFILLDDISDDYHTATEINNEMQKGVYTK